MAIELSRQTRAEARASLQRYFSENLPEPVGDLAADLLINFFVEEIGPTIYNQAIADAQGRLQQHVFDLSGELYLDERPFWPRVDAQRKRKR